MRDKFVEALKKRDRLMEKGEREKAARELSKDPARRKLEKRMQKIADKIKRDKESYK